MTNSIRGCWTIDEKMGQTYIHYEKSNTLAARDFKQPQAVAYEVRDDDIHGKDATQGG